MNFDFNRAQRSKLHIAMLEALDAPTAEPISAEDAAKQAFAEAVCWADSGGIADIGTLSILAKAIDHHVYHAVYHSDCRYADVKADALREVHGSPTVNLALKLAGISPRRGPGNQMRWSDAPDDDRTLMVRVKLPAMLLDDWRVE